MQLILEPAVLGDVTASTNSIIRTGRLSVMKEKSDPDRKRRVNLQEPDLAEARLRQQAIGVRLRHMFDEVVNEPVPDEFLAILKRADDRSREGS